MLLIQKTIIRGVICALLMIISTTLQSSERTAQTIAKSYDYFYLYADDCESCLKDVDALKQLEKTHGLRVKAMTPKHFGAKMIIKKFGVEELSPVLIIADGGDIVGLNTHFNTDKELVEWLVSDRKFYFFYADNCPACIRFKPVFEEYMNESNLDVEKINIRNRTNGLFGNFAAALNVRSVPTLIVTENNKPSKFIVGEMSKKRLGEKLNE